MKETDSFFCRAAALLHRLEDAVLVFLLLTMISMAVFQILLRNLLDSGMVWADGLVRVLVLWIGLLGALAASRNDNHISIDLVSRYLPERIQAWTRLSTRLFTAVVTGIMAGYSLKFVRMEMQDPITAFANVPAWVCESVIPAAFSLICLRYCLLSMESVLALLKGTKS